MPISTKRLGYGGSATIGTEQVLITGGGFSQADEPTFIDAFDISPTSVSRSRMEHADGTTQYTGDLTCDVTNAFLNELTTSKLLGRRYQFDVGINDGEDGWRMADCYLTNMSLTGSPNSIITASLSFSNTTGWASHAVANGFIRDDEPLGYWYSGNTKVREWTFSFSQSVSPMYGNVNSTDPRYLKVGTVEYSLEVVTYDSIQTHSDINISTRTFTLTGVSTGRGFTFGGQTDLGAYRYSFTTAATASGGSDGVIIT
jgi:hypothetical protein